MSRAVSDPVATRSPATCLSTGARGDRSTSPPREGPLDSAEWKAFPKRTRLMSAGRRWGLPWVSRWELLVGRGGYRSAPTEPGTHPSPRTTRPQHPPQRSGLHLSRDARSWEEASAGRIQAQGTVGPQDGRQKGLGFHKRHRMEPGRRASCLAGGTAASILYSGKLTLDPSQPTPAPAA